MEIVWDDDITSKLPQEIVLLAKCIKDLNGFETKGIFRVPGNQSQMSALKTELYGGNLDVFTDASILQQVHIPASVLKDFLREMEVSVFPDAIFVECLEIYKSRDVEQLTEIIRKLPRTNQYIVCYIVDFLRMLAGFEHKTLMSKGNLAIVFAPTLMSYPPDFEGDILNATTLMYKFFEFALESLDLVKIIERLKQEQEELDEMVDLQTILSPGPNELNDEGTLYGYLSDGDVPVDEISKPKRKYRKRSCTAPASNFHTRIQSLPATFASIDKKKISRAIAFHKPSHSSGLLVSTDEGVSRDAPTPPLSPTLESDSESDSESAMSTSSLSPSFRSFRLSPRSPPKMGRPSTLPGMRSLPWRKPRRPVPRSPCASGNDSPSKPNRPVPVPRSQSARNVKSTKFRFEERDILECTSPLSQKKPSNRLFRRTHPRSKNASQRSLSPRPTNASQRSLSPRPKNASQRSLSPRPKSASQRSLSPRKSPNRSPNFSPVLSPSSPPTSIRSGRKPPPRPPRALSPRRKPTRPVPSPQKGVTTAG